MKMLGYTFHMEWCEGKEHKIADALSRYPVFEPTTTDPDLATATSEVCRHVHTLSLIHI